MFDTNQAPGTGAPSTPNTPVAAPQAAPPAPAATTSPNQQPAAAPPAPTPAPGPAPDTTAAPPAETAPTTSLDPKWFTERLERAKQTGAQSLLKELGVQSLDEIKAAITAAREAAEKNKTAEQRAAEAAARAKELEQQTERQRALLKEQAGRMLMVLTAEQQQAIIDAAGDNPEEQLRLIQAFGKTWAEQAKAAAVTPPAAPPAPGAPQQQQQPAAPPAQTAPPPNAPPGSGVSSPPDHRAVYQAVRERNPFAAAAYGLANPQAYESKS